MERPISINELGLTLSSYSAEELRVHRSWYSVAWQCLLYIRSLQTFLSKGHISYNTTARGPDIFTPWGRFGIRHVLPHQQIFCNIISVNVALTTERSKIRQITLTSKLQPIARPTNAWCDTGAFRPGRTTTQQISLSRKFREILEVSIPNRVWVAGSRRSLSEVGFQTTLGACVRFFYPTPEVQLNQFLHRELRNPNSCLLKWYNFFWNFYWRKVSKE